MTPDVLITRDPSRSQDLIHALSEHGLTALAIPVTKTVFPEPLPALPDLSRIDWLLFTSVHGVQAFTREMTTSQKTLPDTVQIGVVGPSTADEVARRLRPPNLVAPLSTALSLADELLTHLTEAKPVSVVWPCAGKSTDDLRRKLESPAVRLITWVCYGTESVSADDLRKRLLDLAPWKCAMFAAPSAVDSFDIAWSHRWDFPCVAIGSATARALQSRSCPTIITCAGVTTRDQVSAILEAVKLSLTER